MSLDHSWLASAITASSDRPGTGLHGTAQLLIGKSELITVRVENGRVVGEAPGTPECQIPLSQKQADALADGRLKLSLEYMRGDLKPTGSTAAILAVIDALDPSRAEPG